MRKKEDKGREKEADATVTCKGEKGIRGFA